MAITTLPPEIAKMCGQLASEQMKAQTWVLAKAIRREFELRISEGETLDGARDELIRRMGEAMVEQYRSKQSVPRGGAGARARKAPQASRMPDCFAGSSRP